MKNNDKLKELSNIIENARKFSIIGEYGNSLEKYQAAIAIIKERQKEILNESEDLKEKWKMTEYNIKSEMLQIKNVLETCLQLHHSHFNYAKKQLEGNDYIKENKKNIEKEIMEVCNKKIYEKNNNNKNNIYSSKINKTKNKIGRPNMNLAIDIRKNKKTKISPWQGNKTNLYKNSYNKSYNSNEDYIKIKKSKSLIVNTMEKKMFNPLEEFYGKKVDNNKKNNKENKINGKDFNLLSRKSEIIQQKINLQKIDSSNNNMKFNTKNSGSKNIQNNLMNKKKIEVIEIDLDNIEENKISNENNEENIDMVEQYLKNLSQLNIDNNDDSF